MKKSFKSILTMAIAAVVIAVSATLSSCSKKEVDVEGIKAMAEKSADTMTEADYDFMIDQVEIIDNQLKGLNKEEQRAFLDSLDKNQQEAYVAVALWASFVDSDRLTEKQRERLKKYGAKDE